MERALSLSVVFNLRFFVYLLSVITKLTVTDDFHNSLCGGVAVSYRDLCDGECCCSTTEGAKDAADEINENGSSHGAKAAAARLIPAINRVLLVTI